jgi:small-conductance mechanosensitive channel
MRDVSRSFTQASGGTDVFGVHLVGLTPDTAKKVLFTLILVVALAVIGSVVRRVVRALRHGDVEGRGAFWTHQVVRVLLMLVLVLGIVSIWFDNPQRLTGALGLLAAGIAVALQRVITSFAAYLIILRGKTFSVGDRIVMGGVRGDVVELGFMQTSVMEMGQPPAVQSAEPAMWVKARQYTGRIVRITNDRIFDSPVYNFTREFPFLWEEMTIPVSYKDDRRRAEQILLEVARTHTASLVAQATPALESLRGRFPLRGEASLEPRVFWRLTDNWIELTVRFIAEEYGVRALKDAISRELIDRFDQAKIGIASGTYEIVGVPPIRIVQEPTASR